MNSHEAGSCCVTNSSEHGDFNNSLPWKTTRLSIHLRAVHVPTVYASILSDYSHELSREEFPSKRRLEIPYTLLHWFPLTVLSGSVLELDADNHVLVYKRGSVSKHKNMNIAINLPTHVEFRAVLTQTKPPVKDLPNTPLGCWNVTKM